MPALSAPFINLQQDGRRKLIIEIVQMHHIRLKVIQHQPNLSACFAGINGLERIGQLGELASAVKIHVACIGVHAVAYAASFMLHAEILHIVPHRLKLPAQLKDIGFRTAVGVKEFIDHQNFHVFSRFPSFVQSPFLPIQ